MKDKLLKILVTFLVVLLVAFSLSILFSPATDNVVSASYPEPYPVACPFGGCNVATPVYETCWIEVGENSGHWGLCVVDLVYDPTPQPPTDDHHFDSNDSGRNSLSIYEQRKPYVDSFLKKVAMSLRKSNH